MTTTPIQFQETPVILDAMMDEVASIVSDWKKYLTPRAALERVDDVCRRMFDRSLPADPFDEPSSVASIPAARELTQQDFEQAIATVIEWIELDHDQATCSMVIGTNAAHSYHITIRREDGPAPLTKLIHRNLK